VQVFPFAEQFGQVRVIDSAYFPVPRVMTCVRTSGLVAWADGLPPPAGGGIGDERVATERAQGDTASRHFSGEAVPMPTFKSNGFEIHYVVEGSGPSIVLVHGFASSLKGNWRATGVIDALIASGRQVIALDCRGHGESEKPHDPDDYSGTKMPDDVSGLMDYLEISSADLMGYSMGGGIAASLLVRHPNRFRTVILGGVGDAVLSGGRGRAGSDAIAKGLEAPDAGSVTDAVARSFRVFAESSGNDLLALAAIQRSTRGGFDPARLGVAICPVMVIVGEQDTLIGSADTLAATIPGAWYVKVPGDHITALNGPVYRNEVVAFLERASPVRV